MIFIRIKRGTAYNILLLKIPFVRVSQMYG